MGGPATWVPTAISAPTALSTPSGEAKPTTKLPPHPDTPFAHGVCALGTATVPESRALCGCFPFPVSSHLSTGSAVSLL